MEETEEQEEQGESEALEEPEEQVAQEVQEAVVALEGLVTPGPSAPRSLGPSAPRPLGPRHLGPLTTTAATTAIAAPAYFATMASLRVLAFDHERRLVAFDTWLDDLQLYLLSDTKDSILLFDHVSGATTAPPATADSATRSQWLSRDAAARLAICNHLPVTECTHFGRHRTSQALYDAVVARYSSPATAALGRLLLPYLFPELSAFATVADLVTHLRTSDARYRATVPAEFLAKKQPPMFITLYFIVSHLPDSLRSVRDHFLSLDPTSLTVDLLEQHHLAAETSAFATSLLQRTSGLLLLVQSAAAASARVAGVVEVAAVVVEVAAGAVVGAAVEVVEAVEVVAAVGPVAAVEALVVAVEAAEGVAAVEAVGLVGGRSGPRRGGPGGGPRQQQQRRSGTQSPQHGGKFTLSTAASPALTTPGVLSLVTTSSALAGRICLGIAAAALGASESGTPPSTAPAQALHTFMLDSGASSCFFRDSTTLTPLPAPVPVRLADPSGGLVVARSSTVLPCLEFRPAHCQRVSICTCTRTGRHLATFTHQPGSSLYTLATEPPQVAASPQVSASGQVAASCSCRLLSHQTLLWHHRLGHPSLPRLRGMHSRLLVSGLPRSLPPLPPSPAPPCLPCVEGRQRAGPHSSSFPPTTAPLHTLHMDVWGPVRVSGQGRERYFLLVVDDYTWYTTVFPLRSKGEDLPVLRLHPVRGGEFFSDLQRDFCCGEGILQSFTLPYSPQQNGIAERRIGLVMEVARTSMIHAAAPHFLWPFAVQDTAHQLNLWPCVSLPETSPTLRWTGKVGDASVFRVWGSCTFVRDMSADKLSARAIPCVFLGFVPDAPGWQFYHPTSRCVLPSQDVTFDETVPFYRLFPYRSAPPAPPPLFLAPDPLPGTVPVQVAVSSGAAPDAASGGAASRGAGPGGAESECAGSRGAEPGGEEPGGAEPAGVEAGGVEPAGAQSEGAESGGVEPRGASSSRGPAGASPRLSPQQVLEWLARRASLRNGATGAGGAGDAGVRGAGVTAGAGGPGGIATAGLGGARTRGGGVVGTSGVGSAGAGDPMELGGAGVGGAGAGGAGARGAGAVDPGARGARGTVRPRLYFVPLLQQVLGVSSTSLTPPLLCPPPDQSQPPLLSASPLPAPSLYTQQSGGLIERHEPASRPVSPVRTARRIPCSRPPPVPGMHAMALRPSYVPLHVPLPAPPESSLPEVPDPESDCIRPASPIASRLLATAITDPSFESAAASSLVGELLEFAAACCLDYATPLEEFECLATAVPRFASMLLAPEGDLDAPDIPTPRSYAEAIMGPYSSQWQAAMDAEMASWKSTGTYVDEVPPPRANIVDGMWIFMVKRPPGSTSAFKARYVARGFRQPARGDLAALTTWFHWDVSCRCPVEPSPASLRSPPGASRVARHTEDYTARRLAALGFAPSTADPLLFQRTDTLLPPFYVLVYVDDLVFATADTEALTLVKSFSASASSSPRHSSLLCLPATRSQLHLRTSPSSCEAEIYAGAIAAQELRWLTYLLTILGEQPRSPPVLYVDNKAMIALCQEHRQEHITKHIALRYFLARELQQGGQLRLAYVATRASIADVFTKALPPYDHQRFSTVLGLLDLLS
ncbi:unnamed protein product [Closterium sp. NIES-53]